MRIVCVCVQSNQSCPTLCNPIDYSPPGSSVHGILQARILEWAAMPSSRGSSWPRDWTWVSCSSFIGRRVLYTLSHLGRPRWESGSFWLMYGGLLPHSHPSLQPQGTFPNTWASPFALRVSPVSSGSVGEREMSSGKWACLLLVPETGVPVLQKPVLEKPSTILESWRTQIYYASGPRGGNTPSSEPQTKGLQNFYTRTGMIKQVCRFAGARRLQRAGQGWVR